MTAFSLLQNGTTKTSVIITMVGWFFGLAALATLPLASLSFVDTPRAATAGSHRRAAVPKTSDGTEDGDDTEPDDDSLSLDALRRVVREFARELEASPRASPKGDPRGRLTPAQMARERLLSSR